ncbi:MAG: fused MFS/spermidine synthase [Hyphomicrobiaceae bacterium]
MAARSDAAVLAVFAATIFVSAFLLFSVQPIFAKMVLPTLGGSPSVWAVSMCFFQGALLAGYCYAHALIRLVPARIAVLVHLLVLSIALLALPFGLPATAGEPPAGNAYLWLIGVLAVGVGLPFFAVSANAPLLQAWFARTGHPHASDPYFLYGASNLGSLIALLSYPIVVEPVLGLSVQAGVWTTGFVLLSILITASGLLMLASRLGAKTDVIGADAAPVASVARPALADRLAWIGLAFVPSGLLVAFTSYITTDIASAPFLWVVPLAAFLGTFILVFRDPPLVSHAVMLAAQPALAGIAMVIAGTGAMAGLVVAGLVGFAAFLVTTMVAHRELYERRPAGEHLTEFYLWMSLGGVLGGVFAAIVAPQVFSSIAEWPLLLAAGMLCRPGLRAALTVKAEQRETAKTVALLVGGGLVALVLGRSGIVAQHYALGAMLVLLMVGAGLMIAAGRAPARLAAAALALAFVATVLPTSLSSDTATRSFFGVIRVNTTADNQFRLMVHGTTVHGGQRLADESGKPLAAPTPITYYYADGPMARSIEIGRAQAVVAGRTMTAGLVGLGSGALACYQRPGESWSFYEIDPHVVRLARDPKHFDFLATCAPAMPIVLGDARLTLAKVPPQGLDYLLIDAFSSDSVPVHLLTREALELYVSKLTPDGLLAMHISNRHMDLGSVAAATAGELPGLHAMVATDVVESPSMSAAASRVFFISRSKDTMELVRMLVPGARRPLSNGLKPWTDDYSNIIAAMLRGSGMDKKVVTGN